MTPNSCCADELVKSYVFDQLNRRNHITLTTDAGENYYLPVIGIMEIDSSEEPPLITRLELSSTEIAPTEAQLGNIFIRISKFVAPLKYQNGGFTADLDITVGFLQSNADFKYLTYVTPVHFEAKVRGNTLVAAIYGTNPKNMPIVGGGVIRLDLVGIYNSYGEFSAKFTMNGDPHPVRLQISNGFDCFSFSGITEITELVPSHATYILDWSVAETDPHTGALEARCVRDVITDVVIGSGRHADLEFSLFDPKSMYLLNPVILAQEPGTNATVHSEVKGKITSGGSVTLFTTIEGTPNRYVLLDTIGAAQTMPTADGNTQGGVFVAPHKPMGIPICCNLKPPGPNSPGSNPVLSNPPGGGGGAPEPPSGGSGQPNSSTSEGGNSCDVNYAVILPPSGRLVFETEARSLEPDEREIAFAGAFRNGARIPTRNIQLTGPNNYCVNRPLMPIWVVSSGQYELSVELPAKRTLRQIMELRLPVDARKKIVNQISVYPPTITEIRDFVPSVVGSVHHGTNFSLINYMIVPNALEVTLANQTGGWILVQIPQNCRVVNVHAKTDSSYKQEDQCQYCSTRTQQGKSLVVFWIPPAIESVVIVTE